MPTVEVSFTALAAHVRTARLVALAVARRAGVDDALLDEVRLAVGEACSRAVTVHQGRSADAPVVMFLTDDKDRFTVEVVDCGQPDDVPSDAGFDGFTADSLAQAGGGGQIPDLPPEFGLAVISGLVEDVEVVADAGGTRVRMTWPATDSMAAEFA